jgi:hypothetical protein
MRAEHQELEAVRIRLEGADDLGCYADGVERSTSLSPSSSFTRPLPARITDTSSALAWRPANKGLAVGAPGQRVTNRARAPR